MSKDKQSPGEYWIKAANALLVGRKIMAVQYMTDMEAREAGIMERPLLIYLDDGTVIYPSSDDEGNGGGAIFTSNEKLPVIPVLWWED